MLTIKILSKQITVKQGNKKRTFPRYFTYMMLPVKGEEQKGKQRKSVVVKFTQAVKFDERFALVTVDVSKGDISAPRIYEVKENAETGKPEYPTVWIRAVRSVTKIEPKMNESDLDFCLDGESDNDESIEITEEETEELTKGE